MTERERHIQEIEKHIQELYDVRNRALDRVVEILKTEDDWTKIFIKIDAIRDSSVFVEEKK